MAKSPPKTDDLLPDPLEAAGLTTLLPPIAVQPTPPPDRASASQQTSGAEQAPELPDPTPAPSAVYRGFYQEFWPTDSSGQRFLGGIEGVIGTAISSAATAEGRELSGIDGRWIGTVDGEPIQELNALEAMGWRVECRLVASYYHPATKQFSAETAWLAWDPSRPEMTAALPTFIQNMTFRIAHGSHPDLNLDQQQLARVLASRGNWYLTRDQPSAELPAGSIVHKRHRSLADTLVQTAINHRIGCNLAFWIGLVLVALLLLGLLLLILKH
ncbi:MAG: hypothetical protein FWC59_04110 [Actinomycetia bacterium]|nr:hypothetical protein [Actinomycetes bacterium]